MVGQKPLQERTTIPACKSEKQTSEQSDLCMQNLIYGYTTARIQQPALAAGFDRNGVTAG